MDIEIQKKWFKNHVAKFTDLGKIKILDFQKPESSSYKIRFLFDEENCNLHISGDLGECVATNYSNMTYEGFKDFVHDFSYFRSKIDCCSRDIFTYDVDEARKYLEEEFKENDFDFSEQGYESAEEAIEDILEDFTDIKGISNDGYDVLKKFDSDAWEWASSVGKVSTGIIETYLLAFELATEQLKRQE